MENQHLSSEPTDAELAQAWAAGDERAYDELVVRFAPLVFNRCRRALGAADADDATQAVFLVLATRRAQAAASPILAAWLMTVTGNVVRNAWRDRQRRINAETTVPAPTPSVTEEPAMPDIQDHLDACLAALPAKEREAVLLHHLAGKSLAEVALQTKSGVSTVKDRLKRGLERLRTRLAARGVALGGVALIAVLAGEARAAVPTEVLDHLYDLTSVGGGTGSTAIPSARVVRWSRPRNSTMTRIVCAAAGILLVGGAVAQFLVSAEAAPEIKDAVAAVAPATSINAINAQNARFLAFINLPDIQRSLQRLKELPEFQIEPRPLDQVALWLRDWRSAAVAVDIGSYLSNQEQIIFFNSSKDYFGFHNLNQAGSSVNKFSKFRTEFLISSATDGAEKILKSISPYLPESARIDSRAGANGIKLSTPGFAPRPGSLIESSVFSQDHVLDVDIRLVVESDQVRSIFHRIALQIDPLRSKLKWDFDPMLGEVTTTRSQVHRDGPIDPAMMEKCPSSAVVAIAFGMSPGFAEAMFGSFPEPTEDQTKVGNTVSFEYGDTGPKVSLVLVKPEIRRFARAAVKLVNAAQGTALFWLQPGSPFPIVNLSIPANQSDVDGFLADIAITPASDGTFMIALFNGFVLHGAWREGRLMVGTDPTAIPVLSGGFTAHPDVKNVMQELENPFDMQCIIRPQGLVDLARPYLAMSIPKDQLAQLDAYREKLLRNPMGSALTLSKDDAGSHIEAHGILAVLGLFGLMSSAASQSQLLLGGKG